MKKIKEAVKSTLYLIKLGTNFKILINFFFFKTFFFIYKIINKKKLYINNEEYFINFFFRNKIFSRNLFLQNIDIMEFFFRRNKNLKIRSYLEIGSFEGSSVCYFLKKLAQCDSFTCIDTWDGKEELEKLDFKEVERKFDQNTSSVEKIKKIKMNSDLFFKQNLKTFDLIYIDGNHRAPQVKKDLDNSLKILNNNGILIIDDYLWDWYENLKLNPAYEINYFYNKNSKFLKILLIHNIVVLQKKI